MNRLILAAVVTAAAALVACGQNESDGGQTSGSTPAAAPAQTTPPATPAPGAGSTTAPAPAPAAGATTVAASGSAIYNKACAACHAAGVTGAPKPGDKADWAARAAQGKDVLYQHATQGFTGQKGVMPPKGGFANLSDEEVKAAVDYMLAQSI